MSELKSTITDPAKAKATLNQIFTENNLAPIADAGQITSKHKAYMANPQGMLGKINNDCTIKDWSNDPKLTEIADSLSRYFHNLTNHEDDEWESTTYEQNQLRPNSSY